MEVCFISDMLLVNNFLFFKQNQNDKNHKILAKLELDYLRISTLFAHAHYVIFYTLPLPFPTKERKVIYMMKALTEIKTEQVTSNRNNNHMHLDAIAWNWNSLEQHSAS